MDQFKWPLTNMLYFLTRVAVLLANTAAAVTSVARDGVAPALNPGRVRRRINSCSAVRQAPVNQPPQALAKVSRWRAVLKTFLVA